MALRFLSADGTGGTVSAAVRATLGVRTFLLSCTTLYHEGMRRLGTMRLCAK